MVGDLAEARLERAEGLESSVDEIRAEARHLLRPRHDRAARGQTGGSAPERGVSLSHGRRVLGRDVRPRRLKPHKHSVEVRASRRRPALDDRETVGREDERLDLAAKLLGRREPRAVQRPALRGGRRERDADVERRLTAPTGKRDSRSRRAEADQLRVDARARREPLRSDVQGLEQVRLARAVRADDEHDARS